VITLKVYLLLHEINTITHYCCHNGILEDRLSEEKKNKENEFSPTIIKVTKESIGWSIQR
jgi:hypothetical protein